MQPLHEITRDDIVFMVIKTESNHRLKGPLIQNVRGIKCRGRDGFMFRQLGFNKFEKEPSKIPENAVPQNMSNYAQNLLEDDWVKTYFLDSTKHPMQRANPEDLPRGQPYRIEFNGGMSFVAYHNVADNTITVMQRPKGYIDNWRNDFDSDRLFYSQEVARYESPLRVSIGIDTTVQMHGNSILVQLIPNRYVYIGDLVVAAFSFPETVTEYYSPIGNSSVPYPVAVSANFVILLSDRRYVAKENIIKNISKVEGTEQLNWAGDAYHAYYDLNQNESTPLEDLEDICRADVNC